MTSPEVTFTVRSPLDLRGVLRSSGAIVPFAGDSGRVLIQRDRAERLSQIAREAREFGYDHVAPYVHTRVLWAWRESLPELGFTRPELDLWLERGHEPAEIVEAARFDKLRLDPRHLAMIRSRLRVEGRVPPLRCMADEVRARLAWSPEALLDHLLWSCPERSPTLASVRAMLFRYSSSSTSSASSISSRGRGGGGGIGA